MGNFADKTVMIPLYIFVISTNSCRFLKNPFIWEKHLDVAHDQPKTSRSNCIHPSGHLTRVKMRIFHAVAGHNIFINANSIDQMLLYHAF